MGALPLASIEWPEKYLPGTRENFCSNDVIVTDLPVKGVWDALIHPGLWPPYYANSSDIEFKDKSKGDSLYKDCKFGFKTFGFPIDAKIIEFVEPDDCRVG